MSVPAILTAVQHDLPIKVVVVRNDTLGLIKWEQMVFLGNREYGVNVAPLDFVKFAEVKDLLDEASFQASPARAIPDRAGQALSGLAGRLRDRADDKHSE